MSTFLENQTTAKDEYFPEFHLAGSVPLLRNKPRPVSKGYDIKLLFSGLLLFTLFFFYLFTFFAFAGRKRCSSALY